MEVGEDDGFFSDVNCPLTDFMNDDFNGIEFELDLLCLVHEVLLHRVMLDFVFELLVALREGFLPLEVG